ncbi:Cytochrome P450 71B35 [Vitis vinifera]|uniref:Cytochrome P450 71B35 n=1 Tax=Vitis vinifera TaxID=29760 RepID=A0A438E6B5_VITVI|nr:Cytochrome P450 71B35 [Vitis vinifera]
MAELARNPRVMKKAQAEVRSVMGNKGKVTESDLDQLLYLKLVVKEIFRLHPPGPLLLPRETMSHFQMNGYHIHPKTRVHVNVNILSYCLLGRAKSVSGDQHGDCNGGAHIC